jgi:hypothetical protein
MARMKFLCDADFGCRDRYDLDPDAMARKMSRYCGAANYVWGAVRLCVTLASINEGLPLSNSGNLSFYFRSAAMAPPWKRSEDTRGRPSIFGRQSTKMIRKLIAVVAPCVVLCLLGDCRLGSPERRY